MEAKALGKGLSALIPDKNTLNSEGGQKTAITYLKTSQIIENSLQPRTHYDEAGIEDLKASIKEKGVLQPILVRERNGQFEVVAGERRLRAAKALNLEEVPAIIKQLDDKDALVIALIENIQREELNPIEEALAFRKLIEDFQYTQEDVAQAVGKDRSTITNLLRLLKLPQSIQDAIFDNKLSVGHARALLSVEDAVEQKRLFEMTLNEGLSVREVEVLVKTGVKDVPHIKRAKFRKPKDHEVAALEDDLQKTLGTKVIIDAKKKKGKIVIEYYSLDDLDRIIQIIKK